MQWSDDAVVIGVRLHGEAAVIAEFLTLERGRHLGFVHGGRSRRLRPVLQPGNTVRAVWQSRNEGSLGTVTVEPLHSRAAGIMETALTLQAVNLICALVQLLPEREPQPELYRAIEAILDDLESRRDVAAALVHLELGFLREFGFGLDLASCAVTGVTDALAYVSPKSGRAVSMSVGEPFRDRILALPSFLLTGAADNPSVDDVAAGFALTEHFLMRDVFRPRGLPLPACRHAYLEALRRDQSGTRASQTVRTT